MNTPAVQPTAQRQMPTIKKIPKTVEILHVVQRQCPSSRRPRRSLSYRSWMSVVDVRVVMMGRCVRFRRAEDLDVATDPSTATRSLAFPWQCKTRFPAAPVRRTTGACDSEMQKDDTVELPQAQHTERNLDIATLRMQHQSVEHCRQQHGLQPRDEERFPRQRFTQAVAEPIMAGLDEA